MPPELDRESLEYQTAGVTDGATDKDTLGFGPYVRAMATFLTNPRTKGPLTLSIEGEWGSGKTSFMLQLASTLEPAAKQWNGKVSESVKAPIVVWFNAWRNDKAEELWAAFALAILRELSKKLTFLGRWKAHWHLLKLRFNWRQGWWDFVRFVAPSFALALFAVVVPAIVGVDKLLTALAGDGVETALWQHIAALKGYPGYIAGYAAGVAALFWWLKDAIANPFSVDLSKHMRAPDYSARVSFIERFHEDFSNILSAYVPEDHKVVCFIDDLDRCDVPKAAELMQAINLMLLDDERMVFLLGMDRQKVAAGLAVKFKDLIPFLPEPGLQAGAKAASDKSGSSPAGGLWFGHDFIEKFVQIAYSLPRPAPDNLDGFFKELVGSSAPRREATAKKSTRWKIAFPRLPRWLRKITGWAGPGPETKQSTQAADLPDTPDGNGTAAVEETTEENQKELVRLVEFEESGNDPKVLKELVGILAPAFDFNPRRLKQFVNLFRLNLATAAATRLLWAEEGSEEKRIRLEQLGKFVALGIRWPDLIRWLERDPKNRLRDLCERAYAGGDWEIPIRVSRADRLRELLRAGCVGENGEIDENRKQRWGLEKVDVELLVVVSPAAPPTPSRVEAGVGSATAKVTVKGAGAPCRGTRRPETTRGRSTKSGLRRSSTLRRHLSPWVSINGSLRRPSRRCLRRRPSSAVGERKTIRS